MLSNRLYEDRTEVVPKVLHTIEEIPLGGHFIVFHLISDIYIHADTTIMRKDMDGKIGWVGTLKNIGLMNSFPIYFCVDTVVE